MGPAPPTSGEGTNPLAEARPSDRIGRVRARVVALEARLARLRRWGPFQHPRAPEIALIAAVAAFTVLVGWLWATRYWAFQTAAWDLGVYNQAFYTTLFDHRLFYYTNDLPAGTHGYLFASHFSPFLFALVPFYSLAPTPSGLLVVQAAGLGLGAIPVYYLARDRLGTGPWPALFAGLYLLSPLTIGSGWYDFHPEAFLPVAGLTAIYFYERNRLFPFLAAWVVTLAVIETAAPFLLILAGVGLVAALRRRRALPPEELRRQLRINGLAALAAGLWLLLAFATISRVSSAGGTFGPGYAGSWSILGAPSILAVYPTALLHPASAAAALWHDAGLKALYLVLLFGSLAFLPFFGRVRYLLPALGWIGLALLSNHLGYYVFNDQYVAYVAPFLIPAAITGVERWRTLRLRPIRTGLRAPTIALLLVAGLLVSSAVFTPLQATPLDSFNAVPHGVPTVTRADQLAHQVIGLIPAGASVLTTSLLFPEVSDRPDAYVIPISSLFLANETFDGYVGHYVNESDYLLVDYLIDYTGAILLTESANLTGFHLEAAADGAYLWSRAWSGPPSIWVPFAETLPGGKLKAGLGAPDPSVEAAGGPTLYHPAHLGAGGFWRGPALEGIPSGTYEVNVTLSVSAATAGPQLAVAFLNRTISVNQTYVPLPGGGHDYAFPFRAAGVNLTLSNQTVGWNPSAAPDFAVTLDCLVHWRGPGFLDTAGWVLAPDASARLDTISILQLSPT